jgi:hypothetical protein
MRGAMLLPLKMEERLWVTSKKLEKLRKHILEPPKRNIGLLTSFL